MRPEHVADLHSSLNGYWKVRPASVANDHHHHLAELSSFRLYTDTKHGRPVDVGQLNMERVLDRNHVGKWIDAAAYHPRIIYDLGAGRTMPGMIHAEVAANVACVVRDYFAETLGIPTVLIPKPHKILVLPNEKIFADEELRIAFAYLQLRQGRDQATYVDLEPMQREGVGYFDKTHIFKPHIYHEIVRYVGDAPHEAPERPRHPAAWTDSGARQAVLAAD